MHQLWTIIFVALLVIAWGIASWHDQEEKKRQRRIDNVSEKRDEEKE